MKFDPYLTPVPLFVVPRTGRRKLDSNMSTRKSQFLGKNMGIDTFWEQIGRNES